MLERNWDEDRVGDWLRSINCNQYVDLFRSTCNFSPAALPILTSSIENNINGENLLEMDQTTLKEMGVKKIGDRVRIGSQAKVFRNRESRRASRRQSNRVGLCP